MKGNKITLPTWRWLGVNESDLDIKLDNIQYTNVSSVEIKNIDIADELFRYGHGFEHCDNIREKFNHLNYIDDSKKINVISYGLDEKNPILIDSQIIYAQKNKELKILLDYSDDGNGERYRYSDIRILSDDNSKVDLYLIQRNSDKAKVAQSITAVVKENATVNVVQIEAGADETYFNYRAYLEGKKANADINAIYFGVEKEKIDLFYNIDHIGKESNSNVIVKGGLANNSKKTFKASLDFKKGCTGSVGNEEEYVTLMSDKAKSIAVPLLLCNEHDVVGNHASSAGKIDKDILFYIMSRGIGLKEAEKMIIESNFMPIINMLPDEDYRKLTWDLIERKIDKAYECQ